MMKLRFGKKILRHGFGQPPKPRISEMYCYRKLEWCGRHTAMGLLNVFRNAFKNNIGITTFSALKRIDLHLSSTLARGAKRSQYALCPKNSTII
jgi:hypothetical protein